jgi:hypothetical protein
MHRLVFLLFLGSCASLGTRETVWTPISGTPVAPDKLEQDKSTCSKLAFAPESNPNTPGPRYMSMSRPEDNSSDVMHNCMAEHGYQAGRR